MNYINKFVILPMIIESILQLNYFKTNPKKKEK